MRITNNIPISIKDKSIAFHIEEADFSNVYSVIENVNFIINEYTRTGKTYLLIDMKSISKANSNIISMVFELTNKVPKNKLILYNVHDRNTFFGSGVIALNKSISDLNEKHFEHIETMYDMV